MGKDVWVLNGFKWEVDDGDKRWWWWLWRCKLRVFASGWYELVAI